MLDGVGSLSLIPGSGGGDEARVCAVVSIPYR